MKFFVPIICLFCLSISVLGNGIYYGDEVSYPDRIGMNGFCRPFDSCMEVRSSDNPEISPQDTCSCNRDCWQYDTCCFDSPYRVNAPPVFGCRKPSFSGYFMVQVCSSSIWKSWCEAEPNGENDILKLTPVTSLDTNTTYKNYYCFRCHETTENFMLWNFRLSNIDDRSDDGESGYRVTYNQVIRTSVYAKGEKPFSNQYILSFELPDQIWSLVKQCNPDIIADCPENWRDKDVLDKCRAYTSVVYSKHRYSESYKNIHCALCNYESLDNISCQRLTGGSGSGGYGGQGDFGERFNANIVCDATQTAVRNPSTNKMECFTKHTTPGK